MLVSTGRDYVDAVLSRKHHVYDREGPFLGGDQSFTDVTVDGRRHFEITGRLDDGLHQTGIHGVVVNQKHRRDVPGALLSHAISGLLVSLE